MRPSREIDHLVKLFGSHKALAEAMEVAPSAVSYWRCRGLPWRRRLQVVRVSRACGLALDERMILGLPDDMPAIAA